MLSIGPSQRLISLGDPVQMDIDLFVGISPFLFLFMPCLATFVLQHFPSVNLSSGISEWHDMDFFLRPWSLSNDSVLM